MATIVPPRLMNLAVLHADASEPHIQPGTHLRVQHNPVLGLPVAPFIVQRASLSSRLSNGFPPRRDVVFRDAANRILTLPIKVEKGDVIRATIVRGPTLSCIFVTMTTAAIPATKPGTGNGGTPMVDIAAPQAIAIPTEGVANRRKAEPVAAIDRTSKGGDLRMQVYGPSIGQGAVLLGERRSAPYTVGAPGIVEVVITGRGIITDLAWLAAQDLSGLKWVTIDLLNLPHQEGNRYLSVNQARARSEAQVRKQAPKRRPLQETQGALAPGSAPAFTDNEERARVAALADPLDGDLDTLIDGAAPPLTAVEVISVTDAAGNPLASRPGSESSITVNHLGRVVQATLDPGVAAWLGYKGLDDDRSVTDPLQLYRVVGFFRNPAAIGASTDAINQLPLGTIPVAERQLSETVVFRDVQQLASTVLAQEGRTLLGQLERANDYMVMTAVAAVDRRAIPSPPARPTLLPPRHLAWLPATPPAAVREVECPVRDVMIGAILAAEREQPVPGTHASLNRLVGSSPWHSPLALGQSTAGDGQPLGTHDGRQGVIFDRQVGPNQARYHLAQQDRFGRWSAFSSALAAAGPRPKPPRPVVQGTYQAPSGTAVSSGIGQLLLRVPLPEADSLAPGSFPLDRVRLTFRHHEVVPPPMAVPPVEVPMADVHANVSTAIDIDAPPVSPSPTPPPPPRRAVPLTVAGPVLQPTEQRRMVIHAEWIDSAGQRSELSEPLRLTMTDPRPPAQLSIPDILLYSSRPDATGLAWIERSWDVPPGFPKIYAAYYSDEVRLLSWLNSVGRTAEAADIAATTDRAARAGKLRLLQSQFPDHLFERLSGAVDVPSPTRQRLRHAVSGSSQVLNAYKIAVESPASGARPVLTGLDLVFYAVPNSDPPARPAVSVKPVPPLPPSSPTPGEPPLVVQVTVTVEPGLTPALTARIYRTRGGPAHPLNAPLIATVPLSSPDPETGRQTAIIRDTGTAAIAPTARLSAYAGYQWLAEVQGAPESGSSVPGLWSKPSDPAGLVTIPLDRPQAPTLDAIDGTAAVGGRQDVRLRLSHPLGLKPTPVGPWRVEVSRAEPGQDFARVVAEEIVVVPAEVADPTPGGFSPLGTQYRIIVIDPTGRPSPPLLVTLN